LGRRSFPNFFSEDVVQGDVEVGMADWDLFEVFDKAGGHGG
jgi:hypothetical protein